MFRHFRQGNENQTDGENGKRLLDPDRTAHEEARTFRRYCQFTIKKVIHALVQARSGEKVQTFGYRTPMAADCVGIETDEIGEVTAYLKRNFSNYPALPKRLNVDFLLHTKDGYDLPLESWRVNVKFTTAPEKKQISKLLYLDMSALLKSVMCAARSTPASRYYVKSQSEDTYVMTYRVYGGTPNINLGEGQKMIHVGEVIGKYGSISVDLHYRTKMAYEESMISPMDINHSTLTQRGTVQQLSSYAYPSEWFSKSDPSFKCRLKASLMSSCNVENKTSPGRSRSMCALQCRGADCNSVAPRISNSFYEYIRQNNSNTIQKVCRDVGREMKDEEVSKSGQDSQEVLKSLQEVLMSRQDSQEVPKSMQEISKPGQDSQDVLKSTQEVPMSRQDSQEIPKSMQEISKSGQDSQEVPKLMQEISKPGQDSQDVLKSKQEVPMPGQDSQDALKSTQEVPMSGQDSQEVPESTQEVSKSGQHSVETLSESSITTVGLQLPPFDFYKRKSMQQMQSCPFAALLQASGLSTCSGVSTPTLTNSASQLTSSATVAVPDAALPRSRYLMQSVNTPRANDQKDTDFQSDGSSRVFGEETRAKVPFLRSCDEDYLDTDGADHILRLCEQAFKQPLEFPTVGIDSLLEQLKMYESINPLFDDYIASLNASTKKEESVDECPLFLWKLLSR